MMSRQTTARTMQPTAATQKPVQAPAKALPASEQLKIVLKAIPEQRMVVADAAEEYIIARSHCEPSTAEKLHVLYGAVDMLVRFKNRLLQLQKIEQERGHDHQGAPWQS